MVFKQARRANADLHGHAAAELGRPLDRHIENDAAGAAGRPVPALPRFVPEICEAGEVHLLYLSRAGSGAGPASDLRCTAQPKIPLEKKRK
jgi:hypothetical protein